MQDESHTITQASCANTASVFKSCYKFEHVQALRSGPGWSGAYDESQIDQSIGDRHGHPADT